MARLCDQQTLDGLVSDMALEPQRQFARLEALILAFPDDARLHFIYGSALVSEGRLIEAHSALSQAVALQPDFAIARFQLGLFQLTSGEPDAALATWGRLDALADGHYLRAFVDGLRALIRDDLAGAIAKLGEGIDLNQENPPLNHDMQMLIDRAEPLLRRQEANDEPLSETAILLSRFPSGKLQ